MFGDDGNEQRGELIETLSLLALGRPLSQAQSWRAFEIVLADRATDAQIGSLLTALALRTGGPSVEELTGAAHALRNHADRIDPPPGVEVADTCGTGGDGASTFNISTCAALIAAGAGATIAKHGSRSLTGAPGSPRVLELLGVNINATRQTAERCLDEARICFCHAPLHHPAMGHVDAVRRQLGFHTIFDLLATLANPAGATRQVVGVYDPALVERTAQVLLQLGATHAIVACGDAEGTGIDELTTTGVTHIATAHKGKVTTSQITPEQLGLERVPLQAIQVKTIEQSAAVIRGVLETKKGPARDIAALNAAAALLVTGFAEDLHDGLQQSFKSIDSGAAKHALDQLARITNQG